MFKHATKVEGLDDVVDIVGTGGDGANTVNISTGASILAAACGARVAKVCVCYLQCVNWNDVIETMVIYLQQGSRSSSSACGSADVLEALGVVIDLGPQVSSKYQLQTWVLMTTLGSICSQPQLCRQCTRGLVLESQWLHCDHLSTTTIILGCCSGSNLCLLIFDANLCYAFHWGDTIRYNNPDWRTILKYLGKCIRVLSCFLISKIVKKPQVWPPLQFKTLQITFNNAILSVNF